MSKTFKEMKKHLMMSGYDTKEVALQMQKKVTDLEMRKVHRETKETLAILLS